MSSVSCDSLFLHSRDPALSNGLPFVKSFDETKGSAYSKYNWMPFHPPSTYGLRRGAKENTGLLDGAGSFEGREQELAPHYLFAVDLIQACVSQICATNSFHLV